MDNYINKKPKKGNYVGQRLMLVMVFNGTFTQHMKKKGGIT